MLLFSGCVRSSSSSQGIPGATTNPSRVETAARQTTPLQPSVEASATSIPSITASASTPSPTAQNESIFAAATATELASQSLHTLTAFPLQVGNSWVYAYQAYSGDEKAAWQVIDTIIAMRQSGGFSAFQLQQEVELTQGAPSAQFINIPQPHTYWYLLAGNAVYRQETLDWSQVEQSVLELTWPFPAQGCWFPEPEQRRAAPPALPETPGCRSAEGPLTLQLPAGRLEHCYHLKTAYLDGPLFADFCEQVGFVGGKFDHAGTPFGDSFQLIAYSLQNK